MSTTWLVILLVGGLLFFLGGLLGSTMTVQAMGSRERQQALRQRKLNAQWQAIQAARHQLDEPNNHEWVRQEEPPFFIDNEMTAVTDELMVGS